MYMKQRDNIQCKRNTEKFKEGCNKFCESHKWENRCTGIGYFFVLNTEQLRVIRDRNSIEARSIGIKWPVFDHQIMLGIHRNQAVVHCPLRDVNLVIRNSISNC